MNIIKDFSNNDKSIKLNMNYKEKSLEIAFKSFFNTYNSNKENLTFRNEEFSEMYIDSCIETILHFQHYFELFIKEILEDIHPMLPLRMSRGKNSSNLYYKLLMKIDLQVADYAELYSVEFSEALNIVCDLMKDKIIDPKFIFILENRAILEALNNFRNRILHRGIYLLRYEALDEFICVYLLPIVKECLSISNNGKENKFQLAIPYNIDNFDILEELINTGKRQPLDYKRIALLKEIGRASLKLPLNYEIGEIQRSAVLNVYEINYYGYYGARKVTYCPICNEETLIYFEEEKYESPRIYFYIKCLCCNFEVNEYIGNIEKQIYKDKILWDYNN